jgi:hypothetical protein
MPESFCQLADNRPMFSAHCARVGFAPGADLCHLPILSCEVASPI